MEKTIGKTPLIRITYAYQGKVSHFYAKLESYNVTGSIKDRIAWYIVEKAKERGELKEGMPIIEATSGNTGIALAAIGAKEKHPVSIFMPNWVSKERIQIMELYGAKVTLFSKEEGGFGRCIEEAKKLAEKENGFLANQFANPDNVLAHYETTGEEIVKEVPEEIGAFVSGIGTGGTLMGAGARIQKTYTKAKIIALEPDKMPLLSQNKIICGHKIEGIGDDFVPDIVQKEKIDKIILVNDEDSICMARKIAKQLGIGVGISAGANAIAAILQKEETKEAVVTVFADDSKKYLSTDLGKDGKEDEKYITSKVEFIKYEVIK